MRIVRTLRWAIFYVIQNYFGKKKTYTHVTTLRKLLLRENLFSKADDHKYA